MSKTVLITGATDGIGLLTAGKIVEQGHHVLLHGRSPEKLEKVKAELSIVGTVETYIADLSDLIAVRSLAQSIKDNHNSLDVLINNAGVLKAPNPITADGLDIRFVVNTIAPYLLTKELLTLLGNNGRVINLSSAAQSPVNIDALKGKKTGLSDMDAYSQSKLAITMWTSHMAQSFEEKGPTIIAVNPGSLLASKMVKEGFGIPGKDINIGAEILCKLALDVGFSDKSGLYFDNDSGQFAPAHIEGQDAQKCATIVNVIEEIIA